MLRFLKNSEIQTLQQNGYMCEHLLCLYSIIAQQTALLDDNFPIFVNSFKEADVIFFGLKDKKEGSLDTLEEVKGCVDRINIISPTRMKGGGITLKYVDWDFHINVDDFSLELKGKEY